MSNPKRDIPRTVRTLLAYQGKTQSELAEFMGIGHSAMSKKMAKTYHRKWTVQDIDHLADFFGVSEMTFLDDPEKLVTIIRFRQMRWPRLPIAPRRGFVLATA